MISRFIISRAGLFFLQALMFVLAVFLFSSAVTWFDLNDQKRLLPYVLISVCFMVFLLYIRTWLVNKHTQEKAKRLVENLDKESSDRIYLYLRPFASDGKFRTHIGGDKLDFLKAIIDGMKSMFRAYNDDFESQLVLALQGSPTLVRFDITDNKFSTLLSRIKSKLGYQFGSYIENSDEWEKIVEATAEKAHLCLVVPPTSIDSSTAKEIIKLLDKGLEHKIVFFMPAKDTKFKFEHGKEISAKGLWKNLVTLTENHVEIPEYQTSGGLVLYLNGKFTLINACSGKAWCKKSSYQKILLKGEITSSPVIESAKVALNLIIFKSTSIIVAFILAAIIHSIFNEDGSIDKLISAKELEQILLIFALLLVLYNLKSHYHYCCMFQLKRPSVLFLTSTLSAFSGLFIVGYLQKIGWFAHLKGALNLSWSSGEKTPEYFILYTLLLIACCSTLVLVTSFMVFKARGKIRLNLLT